MKQLVVTPPKRIKLRSETTVKSRGALLPKLCIICGKKAKYLKGKRTKEKLVQAETMTAGIFTLEYQLFLVSHSLLITQKCFHGIF